MASFPHSYQVTVSGKPEGSLLGSSEQAPELVVGPPLQFGGPGGQWSPEDLLVAAVANCFILSFRAVATASGLAWTSLQCASEGKLDKVDRTLRFTEITTRAKLVIPASTDQEAATKLLHKAEQICLVSNSLNSEVHLECEVVVA